MLHGDFVASLVLRAARRVSPSEGNDRADLYGLGDPAEAKSQKREHEGEPKHYYEYHNLLLSPLPLSNVPGFALPPFHQLQTFTCARSKQTSAQVQSSLVNLGTAATIPRERRSVKIECRERIKNFSTYGRGLRIMLYNVNFQKENHFILTSFIFPIIFG